MAPVLLAALQGDRPRRRWCHRRARALAHGRSLARLVQLFGRPRADGYFDDTDGDRDVVNAPAIGTISSAADFAADVNVTDTVLKAALKTVTVKSVLASTIRSAGNIGAITQKALTAVGLTEHVSIMVVSVIVTVALRLVAATPLANFINANPTLIMLALGFLLMIGIILLLEAVSPEHIH